MNDNQHEKQGVVASMEAIGMRGGREDYFDLWAEVIIEEAPRRRKVGGVFIVDFPTVKVIVGHEFLSPEVFDHGHRSAAANRQAKRKYSDPVVYNRSHVATYRQEGFWHEAFSLGNGLGVCAHSLSTQWEWDLYHTNRVWNKPHEAVAEELVVA